MLIRLLSGHLQKYYSTRQGYLRACTSCGESSWFNWRIVAPAPSDQYRTIAVSDCKRNTSFGVTLTRGTSVQNTFKPYYSRWVFKIMCTRGYDDSCLIERCVINVTNTLQIVSIVSRCHLLTFACRCLISLQHESRHRQQESSLFGLWISQNVSWYFLQHRRYELWIQESLWQGHREASADLQSTMGHGRHRHF